MVAGCQRTEGRIVIDGAVIEHILGAAYGVGVTGNCSGTLIKALVNIASCRIQSVIFRRNGTCNAKGIATDMSTGYIIILDRNIRCDLLDISGIAGIQIAVFAIVGFHAVPVVAVAVAIQSRGSIGLTYRCVAQGLRAVGRADTARHSIDGGRGIYLDLAVGRIRCTGRKVALFVIRHAEIQIGDPAAGTAENAITFGTAVAVGISLNGDDIRTADTNHQAHMGPASGEKQVALLGGIVITHETGVIVTASTPTSSRAC